MRIQLGLRKINNYLSVVVIILAFYIVAAPLLPNVTFWWQNKIHPLPSAQVVAKKDNRYIPQENRLTISGLRLDEEIQLGEDAAILAKGPWHRTHTSTPDKGGNTVIVGHRFYQSRPSVFYHLDKIKKGDTITIF